MSGLCQNVSFDFFLVVIVGVLAQPAPKFLVPFEQQLQRLAHDVGWARVDELRVLVQIESDVLLQAHLKGCSFLLGWSFDKCHGPSSFVPLLREEGRIPYDISSSASRAAKR
jgi:hypothetical protein